MRAISYTHVRTPRLVLTPHTRAAGLSAASDKPHTTCYSALVAWTLAAFHIAKRRYARNVKCPLIIWVHCAAYCVQGIGHMHIGYHPQCIDGKGTNFKLTGHYDWIISDRSVSSQCAGDLSGWVHANNYCYAAWLALFQIECMPHRLLGDVELLRVEGSAR